MSHEQTDPTSNVRLDADGQAMSAAPQGELTERDQAILGFEGNWFTLDEDRHLAIRARFGCSVEEYNLEVNDLIDKPGALEFDPLVVRRLRRHRERRRRQLVGGSATGDNVQS